MASCGKLQGFANRGFRKSPHMSYSEGDSDEEVAELVGDLKVEDSSEASS